MTKIFLTFTFLFIVNCCFAQEKTMLFFKDGTTKTGIYKMRNKTLSNNSSSLVIVNKDTNEKYTLDDINAAVIFKDSLKYYFEVIDVKKYFDDKKTQKKLGQLAYSSPKINMYYVAEIVNSGGAIGVFAMSYGTQNTYIMKNKEAVAYNMGYLYGAGQRGIKKRVRDYFFDCPRLVEMVDDNTIDKFDTLQMVKYYEENCAE
ncbi:MAG: hypothetical protein RIR01_209 [Bacteroidota bacterium]|jgi:hypothetical protein